MVMGKAGYLPARLRAILNGMPVVAVAMSGGVDSRFLCHAARLMECDVLAVHASGPHVAPADSRFAASWAKRRGIPWLSFEFSPLDLPDVAQNGKMRCYACKTAMLGGFKSVLGLAGHAEAVPCDGANSDDSGSYRPGRAAAREAGVYSPLAMAGLGKKDIRRLARATGMEDPEQAPRPCLLTRLRYGLPPSVKILQKLAEAEERLDNLFAEAGEHPGFRLRLLPEPVLHLDRELSDFYPRIRRLLANHGFPDAKIRVVPRLSGFFDQDL